MLIVLFSLLTDIVQKIESQFQIKFVVGSFKASATNNLNKNSLFLNLYCESFPDLSPNEPNNLNFNLPHRVMCLSHLELFSLSNDRSI